MVRLRASSGQLGPAGRRADAPTCHRSEANVTDDVPDGGTDEGTDERTDQGIDERTDEGIDERTDEETYGETSVGPAVTTGQVFTPRTVSFTKSSM